MSKHQFTKDRELAADAAKLGVIPETNAVQLVLSKVASVKNGELNPLDAYIILKELEKVLRDSIVEINEYAVEEAKKYGKSFDYKNASITVKPDAGRWDFSHIEKWKSTKEKLKELEDAAKSAYNAKGKDLLIASVDGELIEPAKYTPGKDNISVKIVKQLDNSDPLKDVF